MVTKVWLAFVAFLFCGIRVAQARFDAGGNIMFWQVRFAGRRVLNEILHD